MSSNNKRRSNQKKATKRTRRRARDKEKDEEKTENVSVYGGPVEAGQTATTVDDGGVGGTDRERAKENALNAVMEKFCHNTVRKKIDGLKTEFASLATWQPPEPAATVFANNGDKNRYKNIPCYDRTRVALKFQVPPETEYIHANYVDKKLSNRYICAQAPMDSTINDWWRLIWQEKTKHIIMLCKLIENGKPKCADYFPNAIGEQRQFGAVTVQFVRVGNNGGEKAYESVMLRAVVGTEQFVLTLHKWAEWPDFGVPSNGMGLLRLLRTVRTDPGSTCLIHCSAGVGRTGTVMAIELGLRSMLEGKEVNVLEIVKELRSSRACAVQTEGQYIFISRCLIEYVKAKKLCKADVVKFAEDYANYKIGIQAPQTAPIKGPDIKK